MREVLCDAALSVECLRKTSNDREYPAHKEFSSAKCSGKGALHLRFAGDSHIRAG